MTEQRPGTAVLYMSGYADETIASHGVLAEGIDLLQKPFTIQTLLERIRQVLTPP